MIKHYRFVFGVTFVVRSILGLLLAIAASSILGSSANAANTPTYTISPRDRITVEGGFLTDTSSSTPVFQRSGSGWELVGAGRTQPPDAGDYVDLSKPAVYFDHVGGNLYSTHVNFTHTQRLFDGPASEEYVCYVGIRTSSDNRSAEFVGVDENDRETPSCTDKVNETLYWSSLTFSTGAIDGESLLGVTIPTCTQTPGSGEYATCMTQRDAAMNELGGKIATECISGSGSQCAYYSDIQRCLNNSERNSVTYCKRFVDAQAILDGDYSSIQARTTDEEIQRICSTLRTDANRAKCIADATAERDRLRATGDVEDSTSCNVQGVGWIICPMITFISGLNDAAFSILSSTFLETEPALVTDQATRDAWAAFRDIANVLFVIAFVAIVYGQMIGGRS